MRSKFVRSKLVHSGLICSKLGRIKFVRSELDTDQVDPIAPHHRKSWTVIINYVDYISLATGHPHLEGFSTHIPSGYESPTEEQYSGST